MKERRNVNGSKRNRMTLLLSLMMVGVLVLAGTSVSGLLKNNASSAYAETAEETSAAADAPASDPSPAIYVTQRNINSVVGVSTYTQVWNQSTGEVEEELISQGSGVVIADGGYVVTNHHVIEDGGAYQILMPSGICGRRSDRL